MSCFSSYRVHFTYLNNFFFSCYVNGWNKFGSEVENAEYISISSKVFLGFISPNRSYNDHIALKFLNRLRLKLSHLRET